MKKKPVEKRVCTCGLTAKGKARTRHLDGCPVQRRSVPNGFTPAEWAVFLRVLARKVGPRWPSGT